MVTLRKIIYDIRGLIRDAKSDDLHFTDRQIAFWINNRRAKLIKERLDKGQSISSQTYQVVDNLSIDYIDSIIGLDVDSGCKVMRVGKLPNIIEDSDGQPLIFGLRALDVFSTIPLMHKVQAIKVKNNKYTKNMLIAFIENEFIYILGNNAYLENLTLNAVFEDPFDANKYITGEDMSYDDPYPMDANLVDLLKQLIISENLSAYVQLPEDRDNDAETAY